MQEKQPKRDAEVMLSSQQVRQCYSLNYKLFFACLVVTFIIKTDVDVDR